MPIIGSISEAGGLFCTIISALVISSIVANVLQQRKRFHPIVPGGLPLIGHALSLSNSDEFLNVLLRWANLFGGKDGTYEFSLFGRRFIVLFKSESIMQAMRLRPRKLQRAAMMSNAIDSLGFKGLFTAEGSNWTNERRLVSPTLNKNHIGDYFDYIKLVTGRLVSKWSSEGGASSTLLDTSKWALDISALSVVGMDFDSLNNTDHRLANDIEDLFKVIFSRTLAPVPYWKLPFCNNVDKGSELSGRLVGVLRGLIKNYREKKQGEQLDQQSEKKTCLQNLVDLSDVDDAKLEEERVVGNLCTLIMAGTDTTSTTLAACLWEIANDTILQDELHNEISASGIGFEELTFSDVMDGFPRLYSLLFEVLRVKGPATLFFLEPGEPLEFFGEVINPGTIILALSRNLSDEKASLDVPVGPKGEDASQFCPRRWLSPKDSSPEPVGSAATVIQPSNKDGGFMPFGHGARVCPGASLAKIEVVTALFSILKEFEVMTIVNHPSIRRVSRFTDTFDGEIKLLLAQRHV